jgi:hypothetical protein
LESSDHTAPSGRGLNRRNLLVRTAAVGAGASGVATLIAACGDAETTADGGGTRRHFSFAYPQSGGTERFLRVVRNGAEQAGRDMGVKVKITATKKFDQVEQGRLVRAAAASKPDGIITGVWDGDIMREPDCELLERFLESLVALKDHAAAATPGPEPEHSSEPYSPALLM